MSGKLAHDRHEGAKNNNLIICCSAGAGPLASWTNRSIAVAIRNPDDTSNAPYDAHCAEQENARVRRAWECGSLRKRLT